MECGSRAGVGGELGSSCEDQQLGRGRLECSAVLLDIWSGASNLIR